MRDVPLSELSMRARKCARRPVMMTTFGSRRGNFRRLTDLPAYTARDRTVRASIYTAVAAKKRGRYVIFRLGTSLEQHTLPCIGKLRRDH